MHWRSWKILKYECICTTTFVSNYIQQLNYGSVLITKLLTIRINFVIDSNLSMNFIIWDLFKYFDDNFFIGKDIAS
jgi:hypothetical protein